MNNIYPYRILLVFFCCFTICALMLNAQDSHEGHDHAVTKPAIVDEHAGHDHAAAKPAIVDEHAGHDHAAAKPAIVDEHAGHDHAAAKPAIVDEHAGHDHSANAEEDELILNESQIKASGIKIEVAGPGNLNKEIMLSGEVTLNSDTLFHHVSRAPGIVVELNNSIGDFVRKGEILATIDSSELGQAKSEFYEIFNEVGCCVIDLQRFQTVAQNTNKLLTILKKNPGITSLQKHNLGDMSDYGAQLLKSYAEYLISSKTFQRKSGLFQEKIVSENDFLNSQNNYEKALADYTAARDNIRFELKQRLFDLEKAQKVNEFKLRTAERKLQLFGLSGEDIGKIRSDGAKIQNDCTDPNCKDCKINFANNAGNTEEDAFSQIPIKSARSGTVTFRNASLGEEVEKNKVLFTVADTSNLWAILQAPARDFSLIKQGMEATIKSIDGIETQGRVILINPVINDKTRTVGIRVTLNNDSGKWLPGSFVTGKIKIAADNLPVVIARNAVQTIDGKAVVFIKAAKGFKASEVVTGREDSDRIEIRSGLNTGQKYVSDGAFALKSVKLTSGMDSHAGHGH